jgi:hypothetical protein
VATADVVLNAVVPLTDGRNGDDHPDAAEPTAINDVLAAVVSNS